MDKIENATDEEVVTIALNNRVNLNKYKKYKRY